MSMLQESHPASTLGRSDFTVRSFPGRYGKRGVSFLVSDSSAASFSVSVYFFSDEGVKPPKITKE